MNNDTLLRQEIRSSLSIVRALIKEYSGLYSAENLTRDVLSVCDDVAVPVKAERRLEEARRLVAERCNRLAYIANRFASRDPALIASSRAQAVAAVDALQDAVFELRRSGQPEQSRGPVLRRRSL
ncbi:hypothetical protein AB4Y85_05700 [Microvirga sp. 2YAF29]|uniref:hypothetical protein n=1 Tax=Microvirga sp. 2YAF29 TaxID=3233031 RepID=UPI003F965784